MDDGLTGRWFDGISSRPKPVLIHLRRSPRGPSLALRPIDGEAPALDLACAEVGWPETWSSRARATRETVTVDLRRHGSLEIDDEARWRAAFTQAGGKPTLAERMQTRWSALAIVLCLSVAVLWSFYRWGTPWAAARIAAHVPAATEREFGERVLGELDARWLKPSKLPAEQRAELRARFGQLTGHLTGHPAPALRPYGNYAPVFELHFRRGIGPNAFALPGGAIILSDEMVEIAGPAGGEALAGVLAHEIGHVMYRHTTRIVVEQSVLNVGLGLAMGDVSAVVALAATTFTSLAYSRTHESEADCFAVALMRDSGLNTAPMAQLLMDAEQAHLGQGAAPSNPLANFLSSHPATAERVAMLKEGRAAGCS